MVFPRELCVQYYTQIFDVLGRCDTHPTQNNVKIVQHLFHKFCYFVNFFHYCYNGAKASLKTRFLTSLPMASESVRRFFDRLEPGTELPSLLKNDFVTRTRRNDSRSDPFSGRSISYFVTRFLSVALLRNGDAESTLYS